MEGKRRKEEEEEEEEEKAAAAEQIEDNHHSADEQELNPITTENDENTEAENPLQPESESHNFAQSAASSSVHKLPLFFVTKHPA